MKRSSFEIEVDIDRDIITVRYIGPLTLTLAQQALEAAVHRPDVSPATAVLLDTTRAEVHAIDVEWLRRYQAYKAEKGYPSPTTALVVSRDEGHQMLAQLWAAIRASAGLQSPGVFTDQGAALEWLQQNRAPPQAMTASA